MKIFCFPQRRDEWIGLMENHLDLFKPTKCHEEIDPNTRKLFTWAAGTFDNVHEIREAMARKPDTSALAWQEQLKLKDGDV